LIRIPECPRSHLEAVVALALQRGERVLRTKPQIPLEHCESQRKQPLTLLQKPAKWPEGIPRRKLIEDILEAVQPLLRPDPNRLKRRLLWKKWGGN
jgi:hypothetical protein